MVYIIIKLSSNIQLSSPYVNTPTNKKMKISKKTTELSEKIEMIRTESGLSRQQFAGEIGCTGEYIRMIETGKRVPKYTMLLAICYVFNRDIDSLWEGV